MPENSDREELAILATSLRRHLERRQRVGIRTLAKGTPLEVKPALAGKDNLLGGTVDDLFAENSAALQTQSLEELRAAIGDCRRCKLCSGRTNLVFGVGNPHAALMFVGEGPGRDEDLQGEPFVGRAGQLLTKMILAINLERDQVYIANVIKCRPPGNRNPEPDEIASCEPFLFQQIDAVRPKVIVALGAFAAKTLLRTEDPISRLRGRIYDFRGAKLIPTFHPSFLLRSPERKRDAWEDLKKARAILTGPVTGDE